MFRELHRSSHSFARTGELTTPHGVVYTPAFVGVATRASIKAVEPEILTGLGIEMVISNAYHLHLRPGEDVVAQLGGLHAFSGWRGPTMTDSGGFQVFSLGAGKEHGVGKVASVFPGSAPEVPRRSGGRGLVRLSEEGAAFRSILDGSSHLFTPESVMTIERKLGADIILPLDECTSPLHDYAYTRDAMERTHRWARRATAAFRLLADDPTFPNPSQALFGIVQGGAYEDLRRESARVIGEMGFDGFAVGGSLGRSKDDMAHVLDWTVPQLPTNRPRHLLGIGEIEDIFACVERGIDTFDCAAPTRMARNGTVFLKGAPRHRINLRNATFRTDDRPIDPTCDCPTCRSHSRGYLQHLCRSGELSYYRLATIHNLRFLVKLLDDVRAAVASERLPNLAREWDVTPA
ncbi:MAG: tRNA guanosine(34) transglycosylase Tgt [Candidatus Bipolaricaulota bacterium]|nr:tRNA guanosine(34) transglycosylase Tgt [Candidatus Bipolaricaulota bacterium]